MAPNQVRIARHDEDRASRLLLGAALRPGEEWRCPDYNNVLIDELRSNVGEVAAGPDGGPPAPLLTTTGARSGEPREAVLTFTHDGDRYVVAGTAGGSSTTPAWVHNLVAEPMVKVEAKGRSFRARAIVVDEAERLRLWDAHVAERPEFADYPQISGHLIPVITLDPSQRGRPVATRPTRRNAADPSQRGRSARHR